MLRIVSTLLCGVLLTGFSVPAKADALSDANAAQAAFQRNDYNETIRRANAALRSSTLDSSTRANTLIIRGLSRYRNSEPELAIPDYNEALTLSQSPYAYWDRGLAYQTIGAADLALADYAMALQLNATLDEVHDDRALIYVARHDDNLALRDINAAIALRPGNPRNTVVLAYLYLNEGDLEKAGDAVSRALAIDPNNAYAYGARGDIAFAQKNYGQAIAAYDRALDLPRFFSNAYLRRAGAYLRLGNIAAADSDYRRAQRSEALTPTAAFSLGRLQLYTHDYEKANESFAYAFEHTKAPTVRSHVLIWRFLLAMRQGTKPGTQAIAHASDAASIPNDLWPGPVIAMYLGHITSDQLMSAAKDTNPLTQHDRVCEAQYYTAEYKLALGQKDQGIALLRQARDTCPPNFIETDGAIMHLAELGA